MVTAACGDSRPFSGVAARSDAAKLATPDTLTPPVRVDAIEGAPQTWDMRAKIAEALRQRDIPAGTGDRGHSAYVLRGSLQRMPTTGKSAQVSMLWTLYDQRGKKVGEIAQIAAVPNDPKVAKPNDDILEAIADAAAESISPIVPSTRLDVADNVTTGEPSDKDRARTPPKKKVTALARMKTTNSGIARNFAALATKSGEKKGDDPKPATPLNPNAAKKPSKAPSAIGDIGSGKTALSRNLARGVDKDARKPAISASDPKAAPKAHPGDDSARAKPRRKAARPPVVLVERTKPKSAKPDTPSAMSAATKSKRAKALAKLAPASGDAKRPTVVTEFYPAARKAARNATVGRAPAAKRAARPSAKSLALMTPASGDAKTTRARASKRTASRPTSRPTSRPASRPAPEPRKMARATPATKTPRAAAPDAAARRGWRYWVQVGSYRSASASGGKWREMRARAASILAKANHRITRAEVGDRGTFYRIHVGPYASKAAAAAMCDRLKAARLDCFIMPERAAPTAGREISRAPAPAAKPANTAALAAPPVTAQTVTAQTVTAQTVTARLTVVTNDVKPSAQVTSVPLPKAARSADARKSFPLATAPGLPGGFK